jgi:hypothetical protein
VKKSGMCVCCESGMLPAVKSPLPMWRINGA